MMKSFTMKEKIKKGELVLGSHVFLLDPAIGEQMALYGYDFVWIDAEHSAFDKENILNHIRAIQGSHAAAIVRVVKGDVSFIKPVLEMGPDGIIFPMINTKEEAEIAISVCLYPPRGKRGFGPRRAIKYGLDDTTSYLSYADNSLLRIVQIETLEGVNNLSSILEVDGIDAVMIGPNDLSFSLGCRGDMWDKKVLNHIDTIIKTSKERGVIVGISLGNSDMPFVKEMVQRGIDFLSCGDDISFIAQGSSQTISTINALWKEEN